jgi:uncharacterized membrane protein YtjA (UPF0391 family)
MPAGNLLYYALVALVIALVAALLGFGGIAGAAAGIAQILFYIFLVIFLVTVVSRRCFFSVTPDWSHVTAMMMVDLADLRGFVGERR